jgi:hypothetical protein
VCSVVRRSSPRPVLEPVRLEADGAVVEVGPDRRVVLVEASLGGRAGGWRCWSREAAAGIWV